MRKIIWSGLILLLICPVWYGDISFGQPKGGFPGKEEMKIIKQEMILIKEGDFLRGTKETGKIPEINEMPQYSVWLTAFYIDKYEVTNAMYKQFVDTKGHKPPRHWVDGKITIDQEDHPVIYVSWEDAVAYARWIGKRLPTEAEWERAARGTEGQNYPWGNEFDSVKCRGALSNIRDTAAVNEYEDGVSPAGCYHMVGNVWEWVQDRYDWRYYKRDPSPDENPTGPADDEPIYFCPEHSVQIKPDKCSATGCDKELEEKKRFPERVIRGGSWMEKPEDLRCAKRTSFSEDYTSFKIGFRCAKDAE